MTDRRTRLLLMDMRDNAQLAVDFLGDKTAADVAADVQKLYALNRAIEIVGEAANKVDPAVRNTISSIPWRSAIAMRNVLIHGYDKIKIPTVVDTIRNDFPPLIAEIERLLKTN